MGYGKNPVGWLICSVQHPKIKYGWFRATLGVALWRKLQKWLCLWQWSVPPKGFCSMGTRLLTIKFRGTLFSDKAITNIMGYYTTNHVNYLRIFGVTNGYATGNNPQKLSDLLPCGSAATDHHFFSMLLRVATYLVVQTRTTRWCPPFVKSWFISHSRYRYIYHKP